MTRITALIAVTSIALAGLIGAAAELTGGDPPMSETERLQQVQLEYLTTAGTTIDELALQVRAHLGLAPAELGPVPDTCDLAHMEHMAETEAALPARPDAALAALIDDLREGGPTDLRDSLALLAGRGGAVVWNAERIDATNYVAVQTTRDLHVGTRWLTAALADVRAAHANIQHEIGGHLFYGVSLSCRIVSLAIGDDSTLDPEALFHGLAYPESEVYAELKELPHVFEGSIGDDPSEDIARRIDQIRSNFPSEVAEVILASMAHRFAADPTLTPEALELFAGLV